MKTRQPVSAEIESKLESLNAAGAAADQSGDQKRGLAITEEMWNTLPEPREVWDYHPESICYTGFPACLALGDFAQARVWLARLERIFGDSTDATLRFMKGQLEFEAQNFDEAFALFDGLYQQFKKRPFQDADPKYLAFYLERRKS